MLSNTGRLALVVSMAVLLPSDLWAQDKVGTAIVDGKKVELFSDRSWRYSRENTNEDCASIKLNLDFCGLAAGWRRLKNEDPEITALFSLDDRNYGMFIVEELGLEDGVSTETMRLIVLENFADGAGVQKEDVIVFDLEEGSFNGLPTETVTYGGELSGISFVFRNTIIVGKNITVQAATYTLGNEVTESFRRLHDDFMAATILN